MEADFVEIIKTLGSLGSIASAYLNVKKALVDSNRAQRSQDGKLTGTLTQEEKLSILVGPIRASVVGSQDEAALRVIPAELLESATGRMKAAQMRFARVVSQGQIPEIEEEEAITRNEVCYFLSIILNHNGGRFPSGSSLEIVWRQFRCTLLYPQFGIRSTSQM